MKSISQKIIRTYITGAAILLLCYGMVFEIVARITENRNTKIRLDIVADFHFEYYRQGNHGEKQVEPLITIYDDYARLPSHIKREVAEKWSGVASLHFEETPANQKDYTISAQWLELPDGRKKVYALENKSAIEWDVHSFFWVELILFCLGLVLFFIAAIFIRHTAKKIATPFSHLNQQLEKSALDDFTDLKVVGLETTELNQTLTAINRYRRRLSEYIRREQNFTRYVSHELRTPMTVIKGTLSILRNCSESTSSDIVQKQTRRIGLALEEMESLVTTFLILARKNAAKDERVVLNKLLIVELLNQLAHLIEEQKTQVVIHSRIELELLAHPLLFRVLLRNLLINAINCSSNGEVTIFVDSQKLEIIDNGLGLQEKPRGYEGYGIGLVLVQDICQRYQWDFSLTENSDSGCTASVFFQPTKNHQHEE